MGWDFGLPINFVIYLPKRKLAAVASCQYPEISRLHGQIPSHDAVAPALSTVANSTVLLILKLTASDDLRRRAEAKPITPSSILASSNNTVKPDCIFEPISFLICFLDPVVFGL